MKRAMNVLVVAVLLGMAAAPANGEVKKVRMRIAGYLCGN